jgi:anaerobic selenocysteine-containing dehydrogenase
MYREAKQRLGDPAQAGTDAALAMAMGHVILKEFFVDRQVPFFADYVKTYTDLPFLPDYLPMVLEYAAIVDPADGTALLQEYRSSVELLRLALVERGTPYAGVLTAVCSTLPGASPADRKAVMAMAAAGPPTESVGLEPTTPQFLPLGGSR